jgi:hypothetical protein
MTMGSFNPAKADTKALTRTDGNAVERQEFGAQQVQNVSETASMAVAARERAQIEAAFVMAERHPRNWDTVRVRLLSHCARAGFAETARYKKPAGKKKINGQWVETFAEGLSARFAETARQEMANTRTETSVVYEDNLLRIVRAGVIDLEKNNYDFREIPIAKAVEKRGKQNRNGEWEPPEGREVLGEPRINSYGEPTYLVKATDDEVRAKGNSEISKAQRDEALRLIPKDIRDDCEAAIIATLKDPKKVDPLAARKKVIDGFASLNIVPDDLVTYLGCPLDKASPAQIDELRGVWTAIKDGETTFDAALRMKYQAVDDNGNEVRPGKEEREKVLDQKLTEAHAAKEVHEEVKTVDAEVVAEQQTQTEQPRAVAPKPQFGKPRN